MLGLVEDEKAVGDGAASDVAEGLDLEEAALHQLFVGLERFLLLAGCRRILLLCRLFLLLFSLGGVPAVLSGVGIGGKEDLEGVVDGLEPGVELLLEAAGQESKGIPHGHDGAADGHAVVGFLSGEVEAGADGGEGLSGSCLAVAGDERDLGI